jgi:hypothetical protein
MILDPVSSLGALFVEHPGATVLGLEAVSGDELLALAGASGDIRIVLPGHEAAPEAAQQLAELLGTAPHRALSTAELQQLDDACCTLAHRGLHLFAGVVLAPSAGACAEVLVVLLAPHEGPRSRLAIDLAIAFARQPASAGERALAVAMASKANS